MRDVAFHDTQPNPVVRPPAHRTRSGCRSKILWLLLALVMLPVFACGLTLVFYLLFPPPRINILVVGVDGRSNEGYLSRTDSIMILGVNPAQLRVSLLSIPRDLFIDTPGYGSQRVNSVNVLGEQEAAGGGVPLLSSAIAQAFGIRVDRYVRLDFNGFVELVNAVGGLDIDVERNITDDFYPTEDGGKISVHFDSGVQFMNGERALIYARTRHADDDYQRAARQQQVLSALMAKLANPARWLAGLDVLRRSVDANLTLWDMAMLAPPLILNRGRFEQLVINRDYIQGTGAGNAIPDLAKIAPWLDERFR